MEELLQDIYKEATGSKLAALRKCSQDALEVLCTQANGNHSISYEIRRACLLPLQVALESKRPKLVAFGLSGFYKILRDDRFHRGIEPEDDSLWMPSQLLCATASVMYHLPDTQVQIFRMYLSLALSPRRTLNGRLVVWICGRCSEAAGAPVHVAAAARAAAAQTLRAYCAQLDEECQELLSEDTTIGRNIVAVSCYSEVIPVIQYLCGRLSETQLIPKQNPLGLFFLDCLLTLMSSLSEQVSCNSHFTTFLWQKFCPSLISFLGTPRVDKNIKSREHEGHLVDDSGRGSGALVCAPSFNSKQAKAVYSIANQLVRLVGSISNLRPVLEALYHRMLLYPPPSHRMEPLRSVKELLQNPRRISQLILLKKNELGFEKHSDDMAIIRLLMDGIEESGRSGNSEVVTAAVECIVALLDSLELLCSRTDIRIPLILLEHWPKLQDADYTGPLTYQTLARLPSPYRDVVAVLQNSEEKEIASSDTSGPENSTCSDGEADSDTDNVFLPSRINIPNSKEKETSKIVPKTLSLGRCYSTECNVDLERHNARLFAKKLQNSLLPKLYVLRTCIEVDEVMQDFSSKCCQHNATQPPTASTIMNADGIYLATYMALLLNLRLRRLNYYKEANKALVPMSEDMFVEEVQSSGVLVYLSATWLRELYQQILAEDLLKGAPSEHALVHLLSDLGGLDQNPVMSDWQRLKEVSSLHNNVNESLEHQASLRWARRILTCIWDSMVTVLSVPLTGYRNKIILQGLITKKINNFGKRKRIAWEGLTIMCLEGLHKAARVSNTLGLQSRCSSILSLLVNSAVSQPPNGKILSIHAISLDILITGGLELGAKAPECWEHIFPACQYISTLEHAMFGHQANSTTPLIAMQTCRNKTVSMLQTNKTSNEKTNHHNYTDGNRDEETCVDVFNFLQPVLNNSVNDLSVTKIVEACRQEGGNVISGASAARVCCALAAAVDTLFTRLASTTTLPTLRAALIRLVRHDHQLISTERAQSRSGRGWWVSRTSTTGRTDYSTGEGARALCRTGDVALRCLRAARPLAHRMTIWTVLGPHFMHAACNKDIQISSLAIQCLHDCTTTLLNQQVELPHFHLNEALLKPFENLLCLELCDTDIQEQIISCICEFVETNRMEIRSGWRPLFNTLRAANSSSHYSAVLEIFKVFLSTDNTLVFANAALDCILCLLSHIKGLHYDEVETLETKPKKPSSPPHIKTNIGIKFSKQSKFMNLNEEKTEKVIIDMCKEALYHLESCANILTIMYNMPKCPIFNTGNRIKADLPLSVVDPIIPSNAMDMTNVANECPEELISYRKLSTSLPNSNTANTCLLKLDKPSNILKVWYVLIEGLISAMLICSKKNQPATMETLFKLLRNTIEIPGSHFGLHCINHLLLPTVQNWLRQISNVNTHWDSVMPNFKQCCGMTTDTIVFYIHNLQQYNFEILKTDSNEQFIENAEATFALKQILLILVECISQPQEPIARLGASCIRHIILTTGHLLTYNQWEIVCISLHRACNVSLTPLKQLTCAFKENSTSFYGDLAMVKVAARRDCSVNDNVRLHAMAQQVFLTDHLKCETSKLKNSQMLIDDRSYIFLIYLQETLNSLNPDLYTVRVPHRGLVVGLLAHQILIQIIATILIQASTDIFQGINSILLDSLKSNNICSYKFLLNNTNIDLLLKSLELSYLRAMQFDSRPGLKFLVQKVSNLDYAANLYKQTTSSWLIKIIALTETFFGGVHKFKLKPVDISIILKNYTTTLNLTLDYDQFIVKIIDLKMTWEHLCNSYVKYLSNVNVTEDTNENSKSSISYSSSSSEFSQTYDEYEIKDKTDDTITEDLKGKLDEPEKPKPFTFADFKNNENSSELDDNENSEKLTLASVAEEKIYKESPTRKRCEIEGSCPQNVIESLKPKNINLTICDETLYKAKNNELLIPPQPVPPEIEQQRTLSITRDLEVRHNCFQNILLAYLELILTFPFERFQLINNVLQTGFLQLAKTVTDPQIIERITLFFDKRDLA